MSKKQSTTKKYAKQRNTGVGMTGHGSHSEVSFSIWLNLPIGAYAIAHRWPDSYDAATDKRDIMVRARKKVYLDRLREQFLPELGPDVGRDGKGTDYGHRAYVSSEDLARAMARMALRIDSPSFKEHSLDDDLHNAYMSMWSSLVKLDDASPYNHSSSAYSGKWGGSGMAWTSPGDNHIAKPEDCLRMGYHWWDKQYGSSTCVDCGAQRTVAQTNTGSGVKYTYTYPKGAIILHTKDGRLLARSLVRRVPGGPPLAGSANHQLSLLPDKPKITTTTTSYGLGYPTALDKGGHNPEECIKLSDHWWGGPGESECRDCGAGRYLDDTSQSGYRFTHPVGSAKLWEEDGAPLEAPYVVTEADVTAGEGDEDEATEEGSTGVEVFVQS